LSEIVDYF